MAQAVSIIIPSRNEFKNLLWTLQGLQAELGNLDYEIIAVLNMAEPEQITRLQKYGMVQNGRLRVVEFNDNPSCWQARNYGASLANGRYVLFLDSHVLPHPGSLRRALRWHEWFEGILHFGVNYWLDKPERTLYQYKWQPDKFWGSWSRLKPSPNDFKVLLSGFAATMIDKHVYDEIGGLNVNLGIYGGGEPYLDLKCQMFGYDVRCNPDFQIYHLTEKRGYAWNNDDLWTNFMIAAYALGDNKYLQPVYQHYQERCNGHKPYLEKLDELRDTAVSLAEPDRQWIQANANRDLDAVLCEFI